MSDSTETHEEFADPPVLDEGIDPSDTEAMIEAAWRAETGSIDPQGPPIGWRPGRRR